MSHYYGERWKWHRWYLFFFVLGLLLQCFVSMKKDIQTISKWKLFDEENPSLDALKSKYTQKKDSNKEFQCLTKKLNFIRSEWGFQQVIALLELIHCKTIAHIGTYSENCQEWVNRIFFWLKEKHFTIFWKRPQRVINLWKESFVRWTHCDLFHNDYEWDKYHVQFVRVHHIKNEDEA
jgi:hypothetical protein